MTDRENLELVFREFGMIPVRSGMRELRFTAGWGGVQGDSGNFLEFMFNETGDLVSMGVWEQFSLRDLEGYGITAPRKTETE